MLPTTYSRCLWIFSTVFYILFIKVFKMWLNPVFKNHGAPSFSPPRSNNMAAVTSAQTYEFGCPYGKVVFLQISGEYAVNILRTALFTVIVRNIFTSCQEYPANKNGLTKMWSLKVCRLSYNRCIFAAKTLTFSSTRYYSPSIHYKNLVLDTVRSLRCIFVTVTLQGTKIFQHCTCPAGLVT